MPLSDKTILDSHCFVHELKKGNSFDDLEYVKSLEKEIDELESEKADFSNIYDLLLEECVSKDVTCSYLHSLSDLNANTELQCLYLHKVKECECLAQKLSKQTESVNNEVHNKLLKSFAKLEKHSISSLNFLTTLILKAQNARQEQYVFNGSKAARIDLNAEALYNEKQENHRVWPRSSMFKMTFDQRSSSLVLHQMTSDHNHSELEIQDHGNEPSSSKLVPKVVPLAVKTAASRQSWNYYSTFTKQC
ncbi:hypothetical protein Tco_0668875 [Tanacetum coccineum]